MLKPMLRRGHYVFPTQDNFEYVKVGVTELGDGNITIHKGPATLSDREGFLVVSTKKVYKVTKDDFFRSTVSSDAQLSLSDIREGFSKYVVQKPIDVDESSGAGSEGAVAEFDSGTSEFDDELREADSLIGDQIKVLLG